ncbi:two pore domain potassium channel family protein [Pseudarthrobacter phenanthrenivorans]|uniref:Two pore domain potassium channel family protein n=1 Tax=Pseudarthrobacter phenanthrenivorans TaxID=361575 RepID=A0A3B0FIU5_PSEPS|nr:potassium channel family protein [Pseudarthrobacter phenanthrenivorans]RKO21602.1 two pore domain potassium channel family protein [Pseudarthrobacter phenanthrenivorans]
MGIALTIAGIVVIAAGLHDMFHTLLHPSGKGHISHLVLSGMWRVSKATGHRLGSAVGPAAMTAVVLLWVVLQGAGWALIYYPHVPGGFTYATGIDPAAYSAGAEALYVSFVTLGTLGFGDVVATDPWVRLASPVEALTGFALLTAALTWFTQIYPPLSRRRALALEIKGLAEVGYAGHLGSLAPGTAARVLDALSAKIGAVRIDFTQYPEGFYFQEDDPDLSLARQLPYLLELRDAALEHEELDVQLSGEQLSRALVQLTNKLKKDFLGSGDDPRQVMAAYAEAHGQTVGQRNGR